VIGTSTIIGEITRLDYPKSLDPGKDIVIKIDGNLVDLSKSWLDFWQGAFTIEGIGRKDVARFFGWGTVIGPEWPETLHLGKMPDASVAITVKMWANDSFWADWDWNRLAALGWKEIVTKTITIESKAKKEEIPWLWIAAGVGILATGIIIASRKEK